VRADPPPASTSRRRLSPETRRREILDAAITVLRDRGPVDCRIEDITAQAGTAKGNFYRYFPTWDDLLLTVRYELLASYGAQLTDRYADTTEIDWWAAVDEEIDRFLDFQLELGGLHAAVFHSPLAESRPVEEAHSAVSLLAWFLSHGIAEGAFASVEVPTTSVLLFEMLHGAADAIASGMDSDQIRKTARRIVHQSLEPRQ
jgi:AcrR family transcriptional regulator